MIDDKTKLKLLREIEKNGNVYMSCLRVGIDKATYYRWRERDREFRKISDRAVSTGRENNCDIGEHALMLKVKDKDLGAIKYLLSHNSSRYKPKKTSNVYMWHKKDMPPPVYEKTWEDLYDDRANKAMVEQATADKQITNDTAREASESDKPPEVLPQS
jgi:hypothetical protein